MTDKLILQALQSATLDAVSASDNPAIPIKMLGRNFVPPNDGKYISTLYLPSTLPKTYWGMSKIFQGIYRLIMHWPNNDEGVYDCMDALQSVGDYFRKDRDLHNGSTVVKVYQNPTMTGVVENGSEMICSVSIPYRNFKV